MKILILLMFIGSVSAAEYIGKDYPYYIFKQEGGIFYCMPPESPGDIVSCWSLGKRYICIAVLPDDGYFADCKLHGE